MKKTILSITIILFVSCIFVSCTKPKIEKRGEATFKLNGVEKHYDLLNSHTTTIKDGEYSISLTLGNTKEELVGFFISSYKGSFPATFNMKSSEYVSVHYLTNGVTYSATNGIVTNGVSLGAIGSLKVVIEKYENNKFSGTFEFTALKLVDKKPVETETRVITEGKFTDIPAI